jgi:hypothetical protein
MKHTYGLKGSAIWILAFTLLIAVVGPAAAARPGGVSHTAKQARPIQLGTSGGWSNDLANGYCCSGTLGSLVQSFNGSKYIQYILSNYHVFASDIVPGGNNDVASTGDPIIQPGLVDVGCNANKAQTVATLVDIRSLPGSNVDAAIAEVASGMVRTDGAILEIGIISAQTVGASLGQAVKKSGRTTGLSRSTVSGLNASIRVAYDNECAGGTAFTKTFTGQIVINNKGSKFLAGGDSGSLMVEDVASNPRAIGLLYAGSSSVAIANPINDVLNFFSSQMGSPVTMVGGAGSQGAAVPLTDIEEIQKAKKAQARHAARLEQIPGGVGHGIGIGRSGEFVIKVYVENDTPEVRSAVPDSVDGTPVEIEETGRIVPLTNCR